MPGRSSGKSWLPVRRRAALRLLGRRVPSGCWRVLPRPIAGETMDSLTDQAQLATLPPARSNPFGGGLLVLTALALGVAGDRFILTPTRIADAALAPQAAQAATESPFSRVGARIVV